MMQSYEGVVIEADSSEKVSGVECLEGGEHSIEQADEKILGADHL